MSYALSSVLFRLGFSNLWKVYISNYLPVAYYYLYFKALFRSYGLILMTYKILKFKAHMYIYFYYYKYRVVKVSHKEFRFVLPSYSRGFPKIKFLKLSSRNFFWLFLNNKWVHSRWFLPKNKKLTFKTKALAKKRYYL